MQKRNILCVGDSLTRGGVGWSYVHFSEHRECLRNEGVDGNTLWGLTQRLPLLLHSIRAESVCIIGIGTNDTLLPHLATVRGWKTSMSVRSTKMHCIRDDSAFAHAYRNMLNIVTNAGLTPVILGLPLTEMEDYPIAEHEARNLLLRQIAADDGHSFVDTAAAMRRAVASAERTIRWSRTPIPRIIDAATMQTVPATKDMWAHHRQLNLTVDGVHWSSKTAKAVASEVDVALRALKTKGTQS
ncbi:SGNH/GDSL hydrolase family protein [Corynebacterium sp. H128]|uniref:SGNH/GDSL hydrolase family protein n=1 Tax=Corynebacterium sp. H128 TaxID=3133427 RepID=UPI0030A49A0A